MAKKGAAKPSSRKKGPPKKKKKKKNGIEAGKGRRKPIPIEGGGGVGGRSRGYVGSETTE